MPKPLPESGTTMEAVDLLFAVGLVLRRLELWAEKRPGFEPMPEPTVLHTPDAADLHMAQNCRQLAPFLGEAHLVHAPGVLDARLSALFSQYQAAGVADESIEAALADVRERLAAQTAGGERIPQWLASRLAPLAKFLTEIAAGKPAIPETRTET